VTKPVPGIPQAESYLPNWSCTRFVVLDADQRWSVPIATQVTNELAASKTLRGRPPDFEPCRTARDALLYCDQQATLGLILFVNGMERECLTLLGRLARLPLRPPILAICSTRQTELLPVLTEAGVTATLFDVVNDVPIADWCLKVIRS